MLNSNTNFVRINNYTILLSLLIDTSLLGESAIIIYQNRPFCISTHSLKRNLELTYEENARIIFHDYKFLLSKMFKFWINGNLCELLMTIKY